MDISTWKDKSCEMQTNILKHAKYINYIIRRGNMDEYAYENSNGPRIDAPDAKDPATEKGWCIITDSVFVFV